MGSPEGVSISSSAKVSADPAEDSGLMSHAAQPEKLREPIILGPAVLAAYGATLTEVTLSAV